MPEAKGSGFQRQVEFLKTVDGSLIAFPGLGPVNQGEKAIVGQDVAQRLIEAELAKDVGEHDSWPEAMPKRFQPEARAVPAPAAKPEAKGGKE